MLKNLLFSATAVVCIVWANSSTAAPILMSSDWGPEACQSWNGNLELTEKLGESGWAENDGDKGHKVLHLYRTDCGSVATVELQSGLEDGQAKCTYGGAIKTNSLDDDVDYLMHAETERWRQMGNGDFGPMKAMMFGRLKFEGPKWEAMKNMGPFEQFLLLAGAVESDLESCP